MAGYRTRRLSSRRSFIAAAAGISIASVGIALPARSAGVFYPGTSVHGIDIGGLDRIAAETMLRQALAPLETRAITYTFDDLRWEASLADLGMSVDVTAMLDEAYQHGRTINPFSRYATLTNQGQDVDIALKLVSNDDAINRYLQTIDNEIAVEPVNAQLARRGNDVEIVQEKIGRTVDLESARAATRDAIQTGTARDVPVPTTDVQPNLYASQLEVARDDATLLIADPIIFTWEDVSYDFDSNVLAGALTIGDDGSADLDLDLLAERMQEIADDANVPPVNVKLGWDSGIVVLEDDIDGLGVNMDEFGKRILAAARTEDERTVDLPIETVRAAARTDNVDSLGITEHIAYGSSLYTGSNETRAANVVVAANNVSYKMVGPGETFSFNQQMGAISEENGFVEGKIIQGDWTASDLGGGVCQVSTTVFRAAFFAGFRFSEWNHHGWRLNFYEADGSPPGLDAAIYQPNTIFESEKDLKFINALDSWLLLMMVLDGESVTAHLYGRPNGWQVEVGEAEISEPIKPGDPVYRENPDLKAGQRQRIKAAQDGCDVSIKRTVTDGDGNIVSEGDFTSNYRAQPEIWEVGPGTPGVTITETDED